MRLIRLCAMVAGTVSLAACSLDLENPNAPTETQVTTSVDGVIALATGLQGRFATSYGSFAYMAGLVTDEFAAVTAAYGFTAGAGKVSSDNAAGPDRATRLAAASAVASSFAMRA